MQAIIRNTCLVAVPLLLLLNKSIAEGLPLELAGPPLSGVLSLPLPADGGPAGVPAIPIDRRIPVAAPLTEGSIASTVRANLSPDVTALVSGNNQFAFNVFQRIATTTDANQNLLVSPFSISSALAMTYAGARGNTAQQMASVLGFSLPDYRLHSAYGELVADLTADQLNVANRLFGQAGYPFKQPFLDVTANDYQAPLEPTNFVDDPEGSRQHINQWVSDQTHTKIQNLLPHGSITTDTRLVLTNAIYFNGKWDSKFDEQNTSNRPFYAANGSAAPANTMFQEHTFRYGQFSGYQMLEMPYAGQGLSMVLMLPAARDGITALESSLTSGKLAANLAAMNEMKTDVYLPKFKFDASFELGNTLQSMGMTDAFDDRANFSGISDHSLAISDVIQKAIIDVNEAGTEAAAATGVIAIAAVACYGCGFGPPPVFDADHPFLFALRDTHSGSLLFMGRVMQPGDASISSLAGPAAPEPSTRLLFLLGLGVIAFGRPRSLFRQRYAPAR